MCVLTIKFFHPTDPPTDSHGRKAVRVRVVRQTVQPTAELQVPQVRARGDSRVLG